MIYPRQAKSTSSMSMSMGTSSMSGMSMDMSSSMTMTGMSSSSTMTMSMNSDSSSNGGLKLTPTVIAILAVIGGVVVSIFVGFWIHAVIREHKLRKRPHASQQVASGSLSVSTYVGTTSAPSKAGGALANGNYSGLDNAVAPLVNTDYDQQQPTTVALPISTDTNMRLSPQRMEAVISPSPPQYSYMAASSQANLENNNTMQQTSLSTPIISPQSAHLNSGLSSRPYAALGGLPKADDRISNTEYDGATLVNTRGALSSPSSSPRPLPRIPQMSRTASLSLSSKLMTSEQKGDHSFLTFDEAGSNTRVDVPQSNVSAAIQYQPDWDNNIVRTLPLSRIRLMTVVMEYEPELPDEVGVNVGDVVRILREFDDGWCIVEQVNRPGKRSGAIPRMCLQERNTG